ncbi:hypothetical protein GOBAR_DD32879 [Gossypium barbadense]|nr:hypothetical protein GOBAR_DD32879 [Gossypium barbadense]
MDDKEVEERFVAKKDDDLKTRVWVESKTIWRIAFPSILSRVTSFGMVVVTQSFLGHIGEVELATYALIQSILVRFMYGILVTFPFISSFYVYMPEDQCMEFMCFECSNELGRGNPVLSGICLYSFYGLWIGLMSGVLMQSLILGWFVWKTDWDEQVRKASERLNRWLLKPPEEDNESPFDA